MKNILFVDDESLVLSGLRRLLRPYSSDWKMTFVTSGAEALAVMGSEDFDVVVTDMRMPGMTGAEFLTRVKAAHPGVARLVLSGFSDDASIQCAVGVAQQYLAKPCDVTLLRDTVLRVAALGDLLNGEAIRNAVGSMGALPAAPSIFLELQRALVDPDVVFSDIARIIESDPGLSAKVLQITNSSFYGLRSRVCDVGNAVSRLGTNAVRDLVLDLELRKSFACSVATGFDLEASRNRGTFCSRFAADLLAEVEGKKIARCAGLIHDVGQLVLASQFPTEYAMVLSKSSRSAIPVEIVEAKVWGVSHAELGGYLLGLWGVPTPVVEGVVYHHTPSLSTASGFGAIGAVHVAAAFAQSLDAPLLDMDFLERAGVAGRVEEWKSMARAVYAQIGGAL